MTAQRSSLAHRPTLHHREEVVGTIVTLDLYLRDASVKDEALRRIAAACDLLHRADATFSTWKQESLISRIRRREIEVDAAPPEVGQVLEACRQARELTNGWFDPWAMPEGLDPSGYVKGWAAQRALEALVGPGIAGGIVNAAGDIATFGNPEEGEPFRIGIVDPQLPRRLACVVVIDRSIATSGTYERGAHLIEPHLGKPLCRVASASVTGPDLGLADALATALAVAGEEQLSMIEHLDGYEGFVINQDGSWARTTRFPFASDTGQGPRQQSRT
jgi:thiamine biosynthesis lipoprotein